MTVGAYISRQKFDPTWFGILVNPFYFARRALRRHMAELASGCEGPVLDVGCGSKPYRTLFAADYTGVEVDTTEMRERGHADFYYDGRNLPFAAGAYSTVLCNQVLEHVFEPDKFIAELARVVRPGGKLLLTVPFVWDEHEQPYD
jgi:SAM-dependent methyltransferase